MTLSLTEEDKLGHVTRMSRESVSMVHLQMLVTGISTEAHRRLAQLREQLTANSPPEAAWILMHCKQWYKKSCASSMT
jgi:hypothetical protein